MSNKTNIDEIEIVDEDFEETEEFDEIEESEEIEEIDDKPAKKGLRINIHLLLILAIVLILGISVYKLVKWNHGQTLEFDPTEDTSEFDVEILDEIVPMAPSDMEGHAYDDETTVLLLGNGELSFSRSDITGEKGFDSYIAEAAGVTVYNAAFPYPTLATRNLAMIEKNYPDDIYSLSYIADAITTGDFSEMDRITNAYHGDGPRTQVAVQTLKNIDYDNLDVIVIMYDAQDYFERRAIENPDNDEERCTIVGSLNYSIRKIREAYPYIRIIVSSLYYVEGHQTDGTPYDSDIENLGNGTLSNYLYNEMNAATGLSVSFLDNFYGTINQNNYKDCVYYDFDNNYFALTDKGREVLAKRIAYAINTFPNDK